MRTGIEHVRAASSLRMVNTAETEGGSPSVIDSRIVTGKGSHTKSRQDGFSMERIVIGEDVFTRDGGAPWEHGRIDPAKRSAGANQANEMPKLAQPIHEPAARPKTLTVVDAIEIDGVRCFGVQGGSLVAYFTPGDAGYLRRWTNRTASSRITVDITELDKPIELKPPLD